MDAIHQSALPVVVAVAIPVIPGIGALVALVIGPLVHAGHVVALAARGGRRQWRWA